jgi:ABC-2 type transport system permease protein
MTPFAAVLRSEWTKLMSLRSTKVALALSVVLALALTALLAVVVGATHGDWTAADRQSWEPGEASLIGGILAAIILTVLALTAATGEYASGTIHLTFTATPRRGRVLAAKTLVVAAVTLAAGLVSNVAMFLLGQALFGTYGLETASLLDGDSLRTVFVGGALAPLLPVVALLVGMAVRSVAAAITGVFAFVFGVPILGELLPRWWQDHVFDYMLFAAADTITNTDASSSLAPGTAVLVVAAWMAVLLALTWALLERRDA